MQISTESIIQAMKCTALLVIVQNEFDLLDDTGFTFSETMPAKAKAFHEEIEKSIATFCNQNGTISEEAFKQYATLANKMTIAMNKAFQQEVLKPTAHAKA